MRSHPSEEALLDFAGDRLTGPSLQEVRGHLDACAPCGKRIEALRDLSADTVPSEDLPRGGDPLFGRGKTIGRYIMLDFLGEGGMGAVYLAYDVKLRRKVALKMLKGDHAASSESRSRFQREARALARVSHANVVSVHEMGHHEGRDFLTMDYVEGATLGDWLGVARRPWRSILKVFKAAAQGLRAVHAAGLVHRDFKPDNVLISADRVFVTDFGLALMREAFIGVENSLTERGVILGTPAYMSPEQYRGQKADAKSDQFSFCVTLYQALYGELPFGKVGPDLARAVCAGVVTQPGKRRGPPWLRRIILKGLRVDPDARHASMDALLDSIDRAERRYVLFGPSVTRVAGGLLWLTLVGALFARGDPSARSQILPLCFYVVSGVAIVMAQRWNRLFRDYSYLAIPLLDIPFVWVERRQVVLEFLAQANGVQAWENAALTTSIFMVLLAVSVTAMAPWVVGLSAALTVAFEGQLSLLAQPDDILGMIFHVAPLALLGAVGAFAAYRVRALIEGLGGALPSGVGPAKKTAAPL